MPANPEEVAEAISEGVKIIFLAAPDRVARENGRLRMACIRMALGEFDASGRRRPEPIEGSEFSIDFDTVIAAVGQTPDVPTEFRLPTNRGNVLQADSDTTATSREGVFAGGDCVTGPASVIEAIAAGRKGASSIDKYLGGDGVIDEVLVPEEEAAELPNIEEGEEYRPHAPTLSFPERLGTFSEVELGFSPESAIEEAKRCLRCDLEDR